MVKNYMKDGKWIDSPRAPKVVLCEECGDKYIKTRYRQNACLRCISAAAVK